jgi:hypothetical protein
MTGLPLDDDLVAALTARRKRQAAEKLAAGEAYIDSGYVVTDELGQAVNPSGCTTSSGAPGEALLSPPRDPAWRPAHGAVADGKGRCADLHHQQVGRSRIGRVHLPRVRPRALGRPVGRA